MMEKCAKLLAVAVVVAGVASVSSAAAITLSGKSLTDLLGADPEGVGSLLVTDMSNGNLVAETHSRAYTDDQGLYAYLYQVYNTGTTGNAPAEMFTLWPFTGADDSTDIGYLTGDIPAGFSSGGQQPESIGDVTVLVTGPQISFYYGQRFGMSIDVGEHSYVMYVMSNLSPDQITGNVINGSVGSGPVVGPIPEPGMMALLALGGLALIRRRKK